MSQLKIYLQKRKRTSKKKNLEHKCILQESCKNRWDVGRDLFCLSREVTAYEIECNVVQCMRCGYNDPCSTLLPIHSLWYCNEVQRKEV